MIKLKLQPLLWIRELLRGPLSKFREYEHGTLINAHDTRRQTSFTVMKEKQHSVFCSEGSSLSDPARFPWFYLTANVDGKRFSTFRHRWKYWPLICIHKSIGDVTFVNESPATHKAADSCALHYHLWRAFNELWQPDVYGICITPYSFSDAFHIFSSQTLEWIWYPVHAVEGSPAALHKTALCYFHCFDLEFNLWTCKAFLLWFNGWWEIPGRFFCCVVLKVRMQWEFI